MTDKDNSQDGWDNLPKDNKIAKISRGALQVVGGAVPFVGGLISAVAGAWSEHEQEKANRFQKNPFLFDPNFGGRLA